MEKIPEDKKKLNKDVKSLTDEEGGHGGISFPQGVKSGGINQKSGAVVDKILIVMVMVALYCVKAIKFVWKICIKGYGVFKEKYEFIKDTRNQRGMLKQTSEENAQIPVNDDNVNEQNTAVPRLQAVIKHGFDQKEIIIDKNKLNERDQNILNGQPTAPAHGGVHGLAMQQPQVLPSVQMSVFQNNMAGQQNQAAYSVQNTTGIQQSVESMNQSGGQRNSMASNQTYAYPQPQYVNPNQPIGQAQDIPPYPDNVQNQAAFQNQQGGERPASKTERDLGSAGGMLGCILGIPFSYYFQPSLVRAKLTLGDYLSRLDKVFEEPELAVRVVLTCVVLTVVGYLIGKSIKY